MKRVVRGSLLAGVVIAIASAGPALAQERSGRSGTAGDRGSADRGSTAASYRHFKPADGHEQVSEELEKKYAQMSEQLQQPVPKRTFETVTGPPKKVKLFRADPKLLENKCVVNMVLLTKQEEEKDANDRFGYRSRSEINDSTHNWDVRGRRVQGQGGADIPTTSSA